MGDNWNWDRVDTAAGFDALDFSWGSDDGCMHWRRADGSTGEYEGPLFALGYGIPRNVPSVGFRRALFDIAFGYVSGFPVRDIIAFIPKSFSRRILTATAYEMSDGDDD